MSEYTSDGFFDALGKKIVPSELGNYVGPNWSDGKFQSSVLWGESEPQNELDLAAYYHDSAYAHWADSDHREMADRIFREQTAHLDEKLAKFASEAVTHGNMLGRSVERLAENISMTAPLGPMAPVAGLVITAFENIFEANKRLPGGSMEKTYQEVLKFYETDPHKRQNMFAKLSAPAKVVLQETVDIFVEQEKDADRFAKAEATGKTLAEQQRKKNAESEQRMKDLAEKHKRDKAANTKTSKTAPPAQAGSGESVGGGGVKATTDTMREVQTARQAEPAQTSNVPVQSAFSRFISKWKKKKKKKNVVHVLPQDIAQKQAEKFKKHALLEKQSRESLQRTIVDSHPEFGYRQGQYQRLNDLRAKALSKYHGQ